MRGHTRNFQDILQGILSTNWFSGVNSTFHANFVCFQFFNELLKSIARNVFSTFHLKDLTNYMNNDSTSHKWVQIHCYDLQFIVKIVCLSMVKKYPHFSFTKRLLFTFYTFIGVSRGFVSFSKSFYDSLSAFINIRFHNTFESLFALYILNMSFLECNALLSNEMVRFGAFV